MKDVLRGSSYEQSCVFHPSQLKIITVTSQVMNGILLAIAVAAHWKLCRASSPGAGASSASPSPSIPLEPKALLGIPHTIFKQSRALRSQHPLSLYLYSEALAKPSLCCFNSRYCCFSIDRVLCLPRLTCSVLFMGHGTHPWPGGILLLMLPWQMKINRVITRA